MRTRWLAGGVALLVMAAPVWAQGGRVTDAFAGMSPEGRRVMSAAFLDTRSEPSREAASAARERVLALLEADTLDQRALGEAMRAEDDILITQLNQRRQRMMQAFSQLSAADRKAWVRAVRAQRDTAPGAMGRRR